jgi:hypothetical protein
MPSKYIFPRIDGEYDQFEQPASAEATLTTATGMTTAFRVFMTSSVSSLVGGADHRSAKFDGPSAAACGCGRAAPIE